MVIGICLFIGFTLMCAWIILGDGADSTPGLFVALFLGADFRGSERNIKGFIAATWCLTAIFFYWLCYHWAFG